MFVRFLIISVTVWPMMGLYVLVNHWPFSAITTVEMPAWVPFWPGWIVPYLSLLFTTWLLPLGIRDVSKFRACLIANIWAWVLVMPWWIISPTLMPRPPVPEGIWSNLYEWLWTVDQPTNIRPCAHAMGPLIAAWFVGRDRPQWRIPLLGGVLLLLPSIAFVRQHRPIDIVMGVAIACVGCFLAERWHGNRNAGLSSKGCKALIN